ncbi:TPA: hypothetical protein ACHVKA_003293 [Yersinia enterocolitica]
MSAIDITTMHGEIPRAVPHLLPEQAATIAKNCHFRHGVITSVMVDIDGGKIFIYPQMRPLSHLQKCLS